MCHGNAGNISGRLDRALVFHGLGLNVFLFDYRGFGRSEGRPSEAGTYHDAIAVHRYLVEERRFPRERLILFGESLGARGSAGAILLIAALLLLATRTTTRTK